MNAALMVLEIDPSIVRPGWVALVVTLFIGAALVLLFFSLRRQVRRISPDLPYADDVDTEASGPSSESQPPTTPPAAPDISSPGKSG